MLLELAAGRLYEAMQAGGNRIVMGALSREAPPAKRIENLMQALELLNKGQVEVVRSQAAEFGLQILPLLKLVDAEYGLKLPLEEYAKQLNTKISNH